MCEAFNLFELNLGFMVQNVHSVMMKEACEVFWKNVWILTKDYTRIENAQHRPEFNSQDKFLVQVVVFHSMCIPLLDGQQVTKWQWTTDFKYPVMNLIGIEPDYDMSMRLGNIEPHMAAAARASDAAIRGCRAAAQAAMDERAQLMIARAEVERERERVCKLAERLSTQPLMDSAIQTIMASVSPRPVTPPMPQVATSGLAVQGGWTRSDADAVATLGIMSAKAAGKRRSGRAHPSSASYDAY